MANEPHQSPERKKPGDGPSPPDDFDPRARGSRLAAELVGTFALTFVDAGGAIIAGLSDQVTSAARAGAAGLTVLALIYAVSDVSGAHFNPAVTFAFALRRAFPWRAVPGYWAAQLSGASLASLALLVMFGRDIKGLGVTQPEHGEAAAFGMEIFLTGLLVTIILSTATRHKVVGPTAALASGATVALAALFSRPISGASMNPARSLGPALVGGDHQHLWIYLTAPFVGALVGLAVCGVVHRHRHEEEKTAAMGEARERRSAPSERARAA